MSSHPPAVPPFPAQDGGNKAHFTDNYIPRGQAAQLIETKVRAWPEMPKGVEIDGKKILFGDPLSSTVTFNTSNKNENKPLGVPIIDAAKWETFQRTNGRMVAKGFSYPILQIPLNGQNIFVPLDLNTMTVFGEECKLLLGVDYEGLVSHTASTEMGETGREFRPNLNLTITGSNDSRTTTYPGGMRPPQAHPQPQQQQQHPPQPPQQHAPVSTSTRVQPRGRSALDRHTSSASASEDVEQLDEALRSLELYKKSATAAGAAASRYGTPASSVGGTPLVQPWQEDESSEATTGVSLRVDGMGKGEERVFLCSYPFCRSRFDHNLKKHLAADKVVKFFLHREDKPTPDLASPRASDKYPVVEKIVCCSQCANLRPFPILYCSEACATQHYNYTPGLPRTYTCADGSACPSAHSARCVGTVEGLKWYADNVKDDLAELVSHYKDISKKLARAEATGHSETAAHLRKSKQHVYDLLAPAAKYHGLSGLEYKLLQDAPKVWEAEFQAKQKQLLIGDEI
jgi:hypothetical protein